MRISTMSIFLKGIVPIWEDIVNAKGGDFQIRLQLESELPTLEKLNVIWEKLVMDLVTKRFPHSNLIVGGRIVDKSFSGKEAFRMEIWTRFDSENNEAAKKIKEFIDQEYNIKNAPSQ